MPICCATVNRCAASVGIEVDPVVDLVAWTTSVCPGIIGAIERNATHAVVLPDERAGQLARDDPAGRRPQRTASEITGSPPPPMLRPAPIVMWFGSV